MGATVSLNMLVRNASPVIERALESVIDFVDEVVITDTGSTDDTEAKIKSYCESKQKHLWYIQFDTETNPEAFVIDKAQSYGTEQLAPFSEQPLLVNWAAARQTALDASACDYVIYLDADDVIREAESIPRIVENMEQNGCEAALCPYIHRMDERGNITSQHPRTNIVKRTAAHWEGPIHEVLTTHHPEKTISSDSPITIDLNDHKDPTNRIENRNLKVLYHAYRQGDESLRTSLMLGLEARTLMPQFAVAMLTKYTLMASSKPQLALAHTEIGKLFETENKFETAKKEYEKAATHLETYPEAAFGQARVAYLERRFSDVIEWTKRGIHFSKIPGMQYIQHSPVERYGRSQIFHALALANLGRHEEAIKIWEEGATYMPKEFNVLRGILERKRAGMET